MNDIEEKLARAALRRPSDEHQAAMAALFDATEAPRERLGVRRVALWQCVCACALSALAGFALSAAISDRAAPADALVAVPPSETAQRSTPARYTTVRDAGDGWIEIAVMEPGV